MDLDFMCGGTLPILHFRLIGDWLFLLLKGFSFMPIVFCTLATFQNLTDFLKVAFFPLFFIQIDKGNKVSS